jgi:hypothetical protein
MARFRKGPPEFELQYDPADIPKFAKEYLDYLDTLLPDDYRQDRVMEAAGKRIASKDFSRANLKAICKWKSPRSVGLLDDNSNAEIEQALEQAMSTVDVKVAIGSLKTLVGVGVKTASAILTAIYPERYTVLDFRALQALGVEDSNSMELYVLYLDACLSMANKYGVTMRNFDRANWQWSKRRSKDVGATHRCRSN